MKVTFIGDGRNDPSEISLFGHTFKLNKQIDIEADELVARKLRGNSHFEVEGAEEVSEVNADDQRDALLEKAKAAGVTIHPRTKTENIQSKIDEALASA